MSYPTTPKAVSSQIGPVIIVVRDPQADPIAFGPVEGTDVPRWIQNWVNTAFADQPTKPIPTQDDGGNWTVDDSSYGRIIFEIINHSS